MRVLWIALICCFCCVSGAAWGQTQADRDAAVAAGKEARELFRAGRYAKAFQLFSRAEATIHSPVFVLFMARCKWRLGELVEAKRLLTKVANETFEPDAPEQWRKARGDAEQELREVKRLIPRVVIQVQGAELSQVAVRIDGNLLNQDQLGRQVEVDPGKHILDADDGTGKVSETIDVAEGSGIHEVTLRIRRGAGPSGAGPAVPGAEPQPGGFVPDPGYVYKPPPARRSFSARNAAVWSWIFGGIGVAGGIATGIGAIVIDSDLDTQCGTDPCHPSFSGDVNAFHILGYTSTITLAVGSALIGTGVLVWVLSAPDEADEDDEDDSVDARLQLSPSSWGFEARF